MWKDQNEFDCIVVGGGPAGSTFARVAAEGGLSVLLLEKDRDIGMPVRCGEAVSDAGLRIFHEPDPRWIASTINRIKLIAPNETVVEFDLQQKGYILDRRIFDYDLAEYASAAGAQIVTKAYIDGLIIEDDKVVGVQGTHVGDRFEKRAKIVVGADRILRTGHVYNKIGTYQVATMAKQHNVPFYVAAPLSTFDLESRPDDVIIEQRKASEVTSIGGKKTAPDGIDVINPAFDMTPPELISGIITENGVAKPPFQESIKELFAAN